MIPWILLDTATVPVDAGELRLYQRGSEFSIKLRGRGELMNSRTHGSEDALALQACARLADRAGARLLIGGLGLGFTLAAALRELGDAAQVVVSELVPAVVDWNRGPLRDLNGHALDDPRVLVRQGDVAASLRRERQAYDGILLDVDNGPEGLSRRQNDWLYAEEGLAAAFLALRPGGVLAVWSAGPDRQFPQRVRKVGFAVEEVRVRAHGGKGARHVIWLASRGR